MQLKPVASRGRNGGAPVVADKLLCQWLSTRVEPASSQGTLGHTGNICDCHN